MVDAKPASAQVDDGLLSFLPFEDDLQDYSSHGHAANPSGMIHFVNGSIGSAVSIDSGYLELQNSGDLLPAYGDYIVSLWFKTQGVDDETPLISKGGIGCATGFAITISNQTVHFTHAFNDWCSAVCEASYTINDNIWHFIAGVMTPAQLQLYVDGRSICHTSLPTSLNFANHHPLKIGGNGMLPLSVDELRVYGRSLSFTDPSFEFNRLKIIELLKEWLENDN